MEIRTRRPADVPDVAAFLDRHGSSVVARLDRLERPLDHPALLAVDGASIVGVLTYIASPPDAEILTLHVDRQWHGGGTSLMRAAERVAIDAGCARLFVITTNDNVDALRFYQRRGFRLAELRPGAVERSRATLKPGIPAVGDHGIPLRDELVLDKTLSATGR